MKLSGLLLIAWLGCAAAVRAERPVGFYWDRLGVSLKYGGWDESGVTTSVGRGAWTGTVTSVENREISYLLSELALMAGFRTERFQWEFKVGGGYGTANSEERASGFARGVPNNYSFSSSAELSSQPAIQYVIEPSVRYRFDLGDSWGIEPFVSAEWTGRVIQIDKPEYQGSNAVQQGFAGEYVFTELAFTLGANLVVGFGDGSEFGFSFGAVNFSPTFEFSGEETVANTNVDYDFDAAVGYRMGISYGPARGGAVSFELAAFSVEVEATAAGTTEAAGVRYRMTSTSTVQIQRVNLTANIEF